MSMKQFPAEFINVDLDIKSNADPAVFVEAWKHHVIPTHAGKLGRRHWLRLTLSAQPKTPAEAIRRFTKLVRGLSKRDRDLWEKAGSKEFDIGIQAGFEPRSGEWVLDSKVVQSAADLGARLRLTVYSPLLLI